MKSATIKQFIRSAVDLGVADLIDLIRTTVKDQGERKELIGYLRNYLDQATDPGNRGIEKTVRRARRRG